VIEAGSHIVAWQPWPENSFDTIAEAKLKKVDLDKEKRNIVVKICKSIHFSTTELSKKVLRETRFQSCITARN
jgi:hypothetical protein